MFQQLRMEIGRDYKGWMQSFVFEDFRGGEIDCYLCFKYNFVKRRQNRLGYFLGY